MIIEGGIYTFDNIIKIVIHNRYGFINSYQLMNCTTTLTRENINKILRKLMVNNLFEKSQRRFEHIDIFEKNQNGYLGQIDNMLLTSLKDFDDKETVGEWI